MQTFTLTQVLSAIRILLSEPNLSDPLMTDIAKEYAENFESYKKRAKNDTLKHATKGGLSGKKVSSNETFGSGSTKSSSTSSGQFSSGNKENSSTGSTRTGALTEDSGPDKKKPRFD